LAKEVYTVERIAPLMDNKALHPAWDLALLQYYFQTRRCSHFGWRRWWSLRRDFDDGCGYPYAAGIKIATGDRRAHGAVTIGLQGVKSQKTLCN
jgi:hypothetical protein